MKKTFIGSIIALTIFIGSILIVNAATTDITAPTLSNISIKEKQNTYVIGQPVYLNLKANDDISGINHIYVFLSNPDSDSALGVDVYDIDGNPYFIVPSGLKVGTIHIDEVDLIDNAGNQVNYTNNRETINNFGDDIFKYFNLNLDFKIDANSDVTAPTINNIAFNKNKIRYGESLEITVDASDDDSGISTVDLIFSLEGTDKKFYKTIHYNNDTKKLSGKLAAPSYNGLYNLTGVIVSDNNNNFTAYGKDSYNQDYDNKLTYKLSFTVTDAPNVDEDINISNIDYQFKKLSAPNIYNIGVGLNSKTDLVDSITVIAASKNSNKYFTSELVKNDSGYFSGYIDINQYAEQGIYYLKEIVLNNNVDSNIIAKINEKLKYNQVELFEIVKNNNYDVITSTTDEELLDKIKLAKDNAKIAISSANSSIVTKEVFQAIKNTNKTIYVEANGIEWIFNGKDITKPKTIDVSVFINYIYNDELQEKIGDIVGNTIVINFAKNGKLPGKALIRVKTDYALRDYLGIENLNVYYYDSSKTSKMFNNVAHKINMTEDGYLEFYINHNSTFIISNEKISDEYISDETEDLALNDASLTQVKKQVEQTKSSTNMLLFAVIGVIAILIVVIVTIVMIQRKHSKSQDFN